jgi:protein TonB
MAISKFDLYKSEWLELVFAKRNKDYGAYYLRQHSAGNTIKAMGITFFVVTAFAIVFGFVVRSKPVQMIHSTEVVLSKVITPPVPPKKEEVHVMKASAPKMQVTTTKFTVPVVTNQPVAVEPPKLADIKGDVGPVDITVPGVGIPGVIKDGSEGPEGTSIKKEASDDEVHVGAGVDVEPEPYGGAAAWAKFLQKNLRYPNEAMQREASGKVWLSFIVEKNGHISSIVVERGAGYGMDEEALRVLKMAPPWKPGMQHGNPVRVKYTLPLNFVMNNN